LVSTPPLLLLVAPGPLKLNLILLPGFPFKTVKCSLIPQEGGVRKAGKHYTV
jgi:hypothetical protein